MENSFETKKISVKFCPKVPLVPKGKQFWLEYNVGVFAPKLTEGIFSCPKIKWKILLKEKEIS